MHSRVVAKQKNKPASHLLVRLLAQVPMLSFHHPPLPQAQLPSHQMQLPHHPLLRAHPQSVNRTTTFKTENIQNKATMF